MTSDPGGLSCEKCGAECCRYIASEIGKPVSKRDYDNIRWFLLHEGVHVFVDEDGDWYVEVEAKCIALADDKRCLIYGKRPKVCRSHGEGEIVCEYHAGSEKPYRERFSAIEEFDEYLDGRGIDWQWKR